MLHINRRCIYLIWTSFILTHISLSSSYWVVQLQGSLLSLHTCKGHTVFYVLGVDRIAGRVWPTLTEFDYVFLGEFFVWACRISRHRNRGKWSCLTSVDRRELTADLTSMLTKFHCHFLDSFGMIVGGQVDWVWLSWFKGEILPRWLALTFWLRLPVVVVWLDIFDSD